MRMFIQRSMPRRPIYSLRGIVLAGLLLLTSPTLPQQPVAQSDRVVPVADPSLRFDLPNYPPSWATRKHDLGAVPGSTVIDFYLSLRRTPENEIAYNKVAEAVSEPSSPQYGKFLTNQQIGSYGPTKHDLDAVIKWLTDQGLKVEIASSDRIALKVEGTASQIAAAFVTNFHMYQTAERRQRALISAASVPATFAPLIANVLGLTEEYSHAGPVPYRKQKKFTGGIATAP